MAKPNDIQCTKAIIIIYGNARNSGRYVYFGQAQIAQWTVILPNLIDSLRSNVAYNAKKLGVAVENEIDGESIALALYMLAEEMEIEEQNSSDAVLDTFKTSEF